MHNDGSTWAKYSTRLGAPNACRCRYLAYDFGWGRCGTKQFNPVLLSKIFVLAKDLQRHGKLRLCFRRVFLEKDDRRLSLNYRSFRLPPSLEMTEKQRGTKVVTDFGRQVMAFRKVVPRGVVDDRDVVADGSLKQRDLRLSEVRYAIVSINAARSCFQSVGCGENRVSILPARMHLRSVVVWINRLRVSATFLTAPRGKVVPKPWIPLACSPTPDGWKRLDDRINVGRIDFRTPNLIDELDLRPDGFGEFGIGFANIPNLVWRLSQSSDTVSHRITNPEIKQQCSGLAP